MTAALRPLIESLESRQLLAVTPAAMLFDPPTPTTLQAAHDAARLNNLHHPKPAKKSPAPSTTQPTASTASNAVATPASTQPAGPPPIIPPGSGFTAATPQPAPIGTGFGASDLAIARWDVVPYQTFSSSFDIGVVAFHSNGIAKVSFSANGGPWTDVAQMSLDPQTGVTEYTAALNAANFPDGQVQIRAIAYPVTGTPRVLDPLFLNADSNRTLPTRWAFVSPTGSDTTGDGTPTHPYATLVQAAWAIQLASPSQSADNGTIYLEPGSYNYGTAVYPMYPLTSTGWLTITPAPGVAQSAVRIVTGSADGLRTGLVHLANLTVAPTAGTAIISPTALAASLWVDNCNLVGQGPTNTSFWTNGFAHEYATNTQISNSRDGLVGADLARNVNINNIGEGAYNDTALVVNCSVANLDPMGAAFHPDVDFDYWRNDNQITYGLTAVNNIKSQGMFIKTSSKTASNIAWVNCNINNQSPTPNVGQVFEDCNPTTNLFVSNCTFVGPAFFRTDLGFTATDVVIVGTTFITVTGASTDPGIMTGVTYR